MIETYFTQLEQIIQAFPSIQTYTLQKKIYSSKQGYISGCLLFNNEYRLDFVEVKDIDCASKIKYRYQYMDEQYTCIFRYDNAPHHLNIATFPHHKHLGEQDVQESHEPTLFDVLLEIAQRDRSKADRLST